MCKSVVLRILVATFAAASAVASEEQRGPWQLLDAPARPVAAVNAEPWIQPEAFQAAALDQTRMVFELSRIPHENQKELIDPEVIWLPMPDGQFARFAVYESPVMAPELAAKFPEIKTYVGQGIDDDGASVRFDWTPAGFHAQILGPAGTAYIDPVWKGDTSQYASYWKRDYGKPNLFSCGVENLVQEQQQHGGVVAMMTGSDGTLRTYRAAVAATGEYTQFHGGTVALGLAAIVTAMNRVTGIYENDLSIRMILVANNDLIVYTNGATDPYSNSDGFAMLSQNQSNLTSVIGSANYDIGHVFSTGGGGVASLGAVCVSSSKARGVTGHPQPVNDPFTVDYVAHEMGHQFGANHSFNSQTSSCGGGNRNSSTAYEHGSGNTIMAYAGICGSDNLQSNSDPYFHSVSLDEIRNFVVNGSGRLCTVTSDTGNLPPVVNAGPNVAIPANTPFELTGSASDPDGDTLTYTWEQRDLGAATTLAAADNGTSPIERPWTPTTNHVRTIPRLSNLLTNTIPLGEKYPTASRTMDWRLVVRDNRAGGGSYVSDDMVATVVPAAGPFQVTFPNTNVSISGAQTVTWNVANTTNAPISTSFVDIFVSTDGGQTFPFQVASSTPNDGSEVISLPNSPTNTARVKVKASNSIFFDISNTNFTIAACAATGAPVAYVADGRKNRYLSIDTNAGSLGIAWQVIPTNVPAGFEDLLGRVYWVGPATLISDGIGPNYWAAPLQCDPYFGNWNTMDAVHVHGGAIVPDADYEVRAVVCNADDPGLVSPPVLISTTVWGDVAAPYQFQTGASQPDVIDVGSMVDRVKNISPSISKYHASLHPATVDPTANANVISVGFVVDAIKGFGYPYAPPAPCP